MKTVNTLFNRIKALNLNLSKEQTKKLGQIIKNKYFEIHQELPLKTVIELKSKEGVSLTRLIAVYPDDFVLIMDTLIQKYDAEQKKALAVIHNKLAK